MQRLIVPLACSVLFLACQAPADRGDDAERFVGTYSFNAGSHSFTPCGSKEVYPLVPGEQLDELIGLQRGKPDGVQLEILAHRTQGPAAEGEGTDEYLALDRVVGQSECP